MSEQILISIGRESGSGGLAIAQKIAEELGIKIYDKNILTQVYEDNEELSEKMAKYEEKAPTPFLSRHVRGMTNSPEENIAKQEFAFISERAAAGESFVVVGRCANEVLKDRKELISIFVNGDLEFRKQRTMEKEGLNEHDALEKIGDTDNARRKYHNKYCESKWGDAKCYDLIINVAKLGPEETANALLAYIKRRVAAL